MYLDGSLLKEIEEALIDAFPNKDKIEQMLMYECDERLDAVGDTFSIIVFNIIKQFNSGSKLPKLITGALKANPENSKLNQINKKLKSIFAYNSNYLEKEYVTRKQSYKLLNPCYFDLTQIMEHCLEKLLIDQDKIFGLAIPCDDDAFQENFCHRLKYELGKINIQIKRPLILSPRIASAESAVNAINRYKELLKSFDIICPIQIQVFEQNSHISDKFWQELTAAFNTTYPHRLIVIMLGSKDSIFPTSVIKLNPPEFKQLHAHQWTVQVTSNLGWEEHFTDAWKQKMITECLINNCPDGLLDIRFVYEHLDYTTNLLKQNLSEQAFLQAIEDKNQSYV